MIRAKLIGGNMDGETVTFEPCARLLGRPYTAPDDRFYRHDTYIARRYVSPYPIDGWDLDVRDDFTRPRDPQVWWITRLWATDEGHGRIAQIFGEQLNPALRHVDWARWTRDDLTCDLAAAQVNTAIAALLALTRPAPSPTLAPTPNHPHTLTDDQGVASQR